MQIKKRYVNGQGGRAQYVNTAWLKNGCNGNAAATCWRLASASSPLETITRA